MGRGSGQGKGEPWEGAWGEGRGQGEFGMGQGEGKGSGKRGQGGGMVPEAPDDTGVNASKVSGKLGKGTYVGSFFMKGEPPKGRTAVEYAEVERAYSEEAMDALSKQRIPADRRDYVRRYFDAIRMGEEQK